jgi:hypothetical protein
LGFVGLIVLTFPRHWVGSLGMPRRMAFCDYGDTAIARSYYSCPELLSLLIDRTPSPHVHELPAHPKAEPTRPVPDEERPAEVL